MVFIGRCKDGMPALSRLQVAGCRLPVDKFRLGRASWTEWVSRRETACQVSWRWLPTRAPRWLWGLPTVRSTTGLGCHSEVRRKTPGPWNPSPRPLPEPPTPQGPRLSQAWALATEFDACPGTKTGSIGRSNSNGGPFHSQFPARGDSRDARRQIG